ncbi:restriction endonuclease subunit S [Anabaenopsis sp. FSS-46]|uniref:restriction endonuclease subunit S n=1 Tax=Anabaenopsis sp. FSS-46 TaxID=2971766 RepID=UPI002473DB2D|nr:restriction endonuclease subunit S [Anabaenopsis sp. FSS-46]MDH6099605.1 restriction endonuclease subunit S [Anabaenopsis sp. FSS-46]
MSDELIELPEGWRKVTLSDITYRITKGTTPTSLGFDFIQKGILFVKVESIYNGYINHELCTFIGFDANEALARSLLQEDDVLFSIAGTLGRVAVVKKDDLPANTNQALAIIRLVKPICCNYIAKFLSSHLLKKSIQESGRGVGLQNINLKQVSEFKIPLPPLNEQKRIVTKIEELSDRTQKAKAALESIPQLCDRFRQSVLAAAFRGDLTKEWREQNPDVEPASVLLERIRKKRFELAQTAREISTVKKAYEEKTIFLDEEQYAYLPKTWISCKINSIGNVCNGSTPPRNVEEYWQGVIPWVSSGEVANNIIYETHEKITELGYKNSSVRLLPKGTVLLAMIGQGKTRGQTSILQIEATINQNIAAIILNHDLVVSEYLWYWFQYQYASTRELGSGSGPQALNCQRVREIPLILAPINEQIKVVECIKYILHQVELIRENYQQATEKLETLNQSILAKAFRGELVPQDPNDEPASLLLERIRSEQEKLNPSTPKSKRTTKLNKQTNTIES